MRNRIAICLGLILLSCILLGLVNSEPIKAEDWIYITSAGPVVGTDKIFWDGTDLYRFIDDITIGYGGIVVQRSNITIDGDGYTLQGSGTTIGFYIETVHHIQVKNTHIDYFETGILIDKYSNEISGNTITNHHHGINLSGANNNRIVGNTIEANTHGIILGSSCSGNQFYHNNFIDNETQVLYMGTGSNTWDDGYPSGGNYWSDFDEPSEGAYDNNDDGIVDDPYEIDENNEDRYPLMRPWVKPGQVWSSRLLVTFNTVGSVGEEIIWDHPTLGRIHAGNGGSIILGTNPADLAIAYGQTGQKFVAAETWARDTLYFDWTIGPGAVETYMFQRHYTKFEHPVLPLEIELFAIGAFDPDSGACEDAVFIKYVIHNVGGAPIYDIEKALYLNLDVPPTYITNMVDTCKYFSSIWTHNVTLPNILFGLTQKPVYQDLVRACGGIGVSQFHYVDSLSGWNMDTLNAIMIQNPWDPYYGFHVTPEDKGMMLIDHPFVLEPDAYYCNEYIIWAYDKVDPVDSLILGEFLYRLFAQEGFYRGDMSCDGGCGLQDIVYLINYMFRDGPGPIPFDDQGDVNCDGNTNLADVVYLIRYVFMGGSPPIDRNRFFPPEYQEMFERSGLVADPVWRNLNLFVDP